jgi:phenylacetate-CoA ligase
MRVVDRLRGSAVVAAHLRGQARAAYRPRHELERVRDRRIRAMVAHAARAVPYYRELFARLGIAPSDIRTAADLDRLPLVDRELVRTRPRQFLAESPAARGALSFLTSGSTGTPIEMHHDRTSLLANIAFGEREREPVNRLCGSFRPRELYVGYETSTFKKVIAFYEDNVLFPVRPRRRFVPLSEPLDRIAAIAQAERPDVLVGYGGWIALYFRTLAARGLRGHLPKLVMYMGEALPHGARELIEEGFGVPVMSRYNAVEAFKLGYFCEARAGFHVHEDLCHLRIVRDDGSPAPDGEPGRIVISNLVNRASVLLNYPIGDVAALASRPCTCGRSFRLLSELEGRVEDILALPDGRFVHPRSVWEVFKPHREVLQYQLVQHEPARFRLEMVTADAPAFARVVEQALPALHRLLGDDAHIEAGHRPELGRTPGQKFRAVVACRRPPGD